MSEEVFTELEKTKLKEWFDKIDGDKNGLITAAELQAAAAHLGSEMGDERAKELIAACDPEGTGSIDFEHFCVGLAVVYATVKVAVVLLAAFAALDVDKSGYITADNLKQIIAETGAAVPPEKVDELVAKADKSGDGQISIDEFVQGIAAYLKSQQ